jgi:hypothetical protein
MILITANQNFALDLKGFKAFMDEPDYLLVNDVWISIFKDLWTEDTPCTILPLRLRPPVVDVVIPLQEPM